MKEWDKGRVGRFVLALVLGSILGLFVSEPVRKRLAPDTDTAAALKGAGVLDLSEEELHAGTAWAYVRAMQQRNWDYVVDHTLWMQERLERAARTGEGSETARAVLMDALSEHEDARNQLKYEGIEDQYIFAPGAQCSVLGADVGRDDLVRPVAMRVWIQVRFPEPRWALRDLNNLAVRSLVVGVNVSEDGYVLKANIIGNLDIRWNSIAYNSNEEMGE